MPPSVVGWSITPETCGVIYMPHPCRCIIPSELMGMCLNVLGGSRRLKLLLWYLIWWLSKSRDDLKLRGLIAAEEEQRQFHIDLRLLICKCSESVCYGWTFSLPNKDDFELLWVDAVSESVPILIKYSRFRSWWNEISTNSLLISSGIVLSQIYLNW